MEMTEAIKMAIEAVNNAGFTNATSDNVTSIACTLYIQATKGQPRGSYSSGGRADRPQQTRNVPPGQNMQVGAPCAKCGTPLKMSKAGNPYCSCWYN